MVKQTAADRRRYLRAKRILSIEYKLVQSNRRDADRLWHLSTTQDMSVTGIAFYTAEEYRVGEVLKVHVVMSGVLDIFEGFGKIVRVEKKKTGAHYLIAVKLIDNPAKRRRAKSYTHRRSSKIKSRKRI
jgi:c-di-GMP-binding flagellar brake protein YcgR